MANDGTVKIGTELDDSGFKSGLSKLGSVASGALKGAGAVISGVAAAASGAVAALLALESATEEYRIAQGKLNTAFDAAGYGPEVAAEAYTRFYEILGDTDTATEASQLLAKLAESEEDVATWADIAAGVSGTFGDSLPIEGLIEASNETAKVGQVTGVLADALNWAGISEDEFNKKLAACTSESERNQLIMETLSGTYDEASEAFYRNNNALVAARNAQAQMDSALAKLGEAVSDVKTRLTVEFLPAISQVTEGLAGMLSGTEGAEEQFSQGIGSLISSAVEMLPQFLDFGVQIISSVLSGIIENIPLIIEAIPQIIENIASSIFDLLPQIFAAGEQILTSLGDGLVETIPNLIAELPQIITSIVDFLAENYPTILEKGMEIVTNLVEGILAAIPDLVAKLPQIITSIVNYLTRSLPTLLSSGVKLLTSLIKGIISAIPQLVAALPQIIRAIVEGIGSLLGSIVDIGKDIVEGIKKGISNAWNSFKNWVSNKFNDLVSGVKSFLGISSPSKVFASIGEYMAEGVGVGWDAQFENIKRSIDKSLDFTAAVKQKIPVLQFANSYMVPRSVYDKQNISNNYTTNSNFMLNVYVSGIAENKTDAKNIGKEIGEEAQREMRRRGLVIA